MADDEPDDVLDEIVGAEVGDDRNDEGHQQLSAAEDRDGDEHRDCESREIRNQPENWAVDIAHACQRTKPGSIAEADASVEPMTQTRWSAVRDNQVPDDVQRRLL